ncbi:MAG: hypothetical protein IPK57_03515 [Chitinophagaceae bacterium]|nr:hypothetical protein [Chitinophagaceae bacterium]
MVYICQEGFNIRAKAGYEANSFLTQLGFHGSKGLTLFRGLASGFSGTYQGWQAAGSSITGTSMLGRANLAVSGGLAMYSLANLAWQKATMQSFGETGESIDLPLVDVFATMDFSQKSKEAERHMMNNHFDKYWEAKRKVEARGSRGGGSHWKAPKPGGSNDPCPPDGAGGTQKPPGALGVALSTTEAIASWDPNEIIGPDGVPDKSWVSINDRLPYTVTYENDISASAPAKYVKVVVPVHEKMDAATFQLGSFGFNSLTFTVPPATASYYQRLDCRDSLGLFVDVIAGYDVVNNHAFWEFQSIDPVTLLAPADPLKGFLLLQDSTNQTYGHGFVNFSIKPVTTAQTLDTVLASAEIIFDSNEIIPTNIEKKYN